MSEPAAPEQEQRPDPEDDEDPTGRYTEEVVPFTAGDGLECNLVHIRGERSPDRGPVLLVHGAGVRANIFRAPVKTTIVDALIERGHDVWLENWRGSVDLPPNEWTLDQAAAYDHPVAVRTVVEATGADTVQAVIHCQGSTSFMMSAVAGLVPEVGTIISNAVTLHPVIPRFSEFKIRRIAPLVARLTPFIDPRWGLDPPTALARVLGLWVALTHHECDNPVCKWVSFTYGTGFPALWSHENLNDQTHEWLKGEFGHVPLSFFAQMARCVVEGHLVSVEDLEGLPASYVRTSPQTDARLVFLAGEQNRCFLAAGQQRTFDYFESLRRGYHAIYRLPDYGHLDMFMGKHAARDVFPLILEELEK